MKFIFSLILFCVAASTVSAQTQLTLTPSEDTCMVTFIITDYDSIPESKVLLTVSSTDGTVKKQIISNIDGKCDMLLPEGKDYKMSIFKFGISYDFVGVLHIPKEPGIILFDQWLKIRLVQKYVRSYKLEHIYFDLNKYELKPESYKDLDEVVKAMKANPKMKIEIAGHTDNIGDDESNLRLSQQRSDAVVAYLISKGISADRLIAKGYGERKPVAENTTEAGRAKNRRTEVRIIEE